MDGARNVLEAMPVLNGEHKFSDQFPGAAGNDRGPEDRVVVSGNYLQEPIGVAFGDGPVDLLHRARVNANAGSKLDAGVFLGPSNVCDLRVGVSDPRHEVRETGSTTGQHGVPYRLERLPPRQMCELLFADDVPGRINVFDVGPEPVVDADSPVRILDARLVESKFSHRGRTAGGHQQHVAYRSGFSRLHNDVSTFVPHRLRAVVNESNPLPLKDRAERLPGFRFVSCQEIAIDQCNLRAEPPIGLGQFGTDGAGADDRQGAG